MFEDSLGLALGAGKRSERKQLNFGANREPLVQLVDKAILQARVVLRFNPHD